MTTTDVVIYETASEARADGATHAGLLPDGRRAVSCGQHPSVLDGLRVGNISATKRAVEHPNYHKIYETLRRSQLKFQVDNSRPDAPKHDCGFVEGTFACRIRHIHLTTGAAKAAEDFS